MPGVKGAGGPVPKRSDQRRHRNETAKKPTKAPGAAKVTKPRVDPKWHPIAKRWFLSLAPSGQAIFYQASDWAVAYLLAESISRELQPQPIVTGDGVTMMTVPPKAATVSAWLKGMTALLATEGDRRRAALELERPVAQEADDGKVSQLDDARRRLRESG